MPAPVSHPGQRLASADIEGFDSLAELALDMRWSWNHATDQVWRQLDPVLWALTHNPWSSCRRFRGRSSNKSSLTPLSAKTLTIWWKANEMPRRRTRGFRRPTRSLR